MSWNGLRCLVRIFPGGSPCGRGAWLRGLAAALLLGAVGLTGGCYVPATRACPSCAPLVLGERPAIPVGAERVFVLMPGLLGFGWEWDGALAALRRLPDTAVLVYDWDPWQSVDVSSERLSEHLGYLLRRLPRSVREVTVIGHSAAGLLVTDSAGSVRAPAGVRVRVWAVGAPLAGSGVNLYGGTDMRGAPLPITLGGGFRHWPRPAPGVELEVYATGPDDPVMKRRLGHDPGDRRAVPRGARYEPLPREVGHNSALSFLCEKVAAETAQAKLKAAKVPVLADAAAPAVPASPAAATAATPATTPGAAAPTPRSPARAGLRQKPRL